MWFRQLQLYQLSNTLPLTQALITEKLEPLAFSPCLPSMPFSMGWVSPIDEEGAPLVRTINGCIMLCLQIEEKILPASVIRKELEQKIKKTEAAEDRRLRRSEKNLMKDELIITLMPRAFTKLTRIYGYIDTRNQWLILGSTNIKKSEQFISMLKKAIGGDFSVFDVKDISAITTNWLKEQNYPTHFAVEKSCLLSDPNQANRAIRCQQQDLFASSIQSLIKDGCEVMQLALSWQDQIQFVLLNNFTLRGLRFQEEMRAQVNDAEAETKQQRFDVDFLLMTETFSNLLKALLDCFPVVMTAHQPVLAKVASL